MEQEYFVTKKDVANLLKDARARCKLSVDEVAVSLTSYGFDIAAKTIYNYEAGTSQPSVSMFLVMCKIYGIEDPAKAMKIGYTRKVEVTPKEEFLLERFRKASPEMQDAALRVLEPIEEESISSLVG